MEHQAALHFKVGAMTLTAVTANLCREMLHMAKIAQTFSAPPSRMGLAAGRRSEEETDLGMRHPRWHSDDSEDPECRPDESNRRQSLAWLRREFCIPCGTPSSRNKKSPADSRGFSIWRGILPGRGVRGQDLPVCRAHLCDEAADRLVALPRKIAVQRADLL
jgi:hypothetical protein